MSQIGCWKFVIYLFVVFLTVPFELVKDCAGRG